MDTSSGRASRRLEASAAPALAAAGAPLQPLGPWADAVTRSFVPLITHAPRGDAAERFRGRLSAQQLGGARASIVAGSSIGVARTPREIARENPGYIKVGVQLGGSGVITQDGRDAVLRAGDFAVYDTTRPYALRFDEPFRMFVLMFPIEALHVDLVRAPHQLEPVIAALGDTAILSLGVVDGRTYAFIGLERIGGVMIYDVTVPTAATFVDYVNPRDFTLSPTGAAPTDNGPEGLAFITAANSPTGSPLLVIGNEVSGTTAIYSVVSAP
jgi:hypothetical protein